MGKTKVLKATKVFCKLQVKWALETSVWNYQSKSYRRTAIMETEEMGISNSFNDLIMI
jgi:hypothetical protein